VLGFTGHGGARKRLLEMGIVPGTRITINRVAPLGDPIEVLVKGYHLSLRRSEAAEVRVEVI
jgi:Fe2+ transport system protein FeoA